MMVVWIVCELLLIGIALRWAWRYGRHINKRPPMPEVRWERSPQCRVLDEQIAKSRERS